MNLNLRKTVLLMSACAAVGFVCPAYASNETAPQAVQQSKTVSGTVVDADGPVIGATVLEKGTSNGTVTDIDGNFTLNVQPGATIVISYVGYKTQEIAVGNQSVINVNIAEDADVLEEGGLITQTSLCKRDIGGSGHEVIGGNGDDDAVLVKHHVHDLFLVVLLLEGAADVLALGHRPGAGRTAAAVKNVEVAQIDHANLGTLLLAGHQGGFQQNLAVAVLSSCGDAHDFVAHVGVLLKI